MNDVTYFFSGWEPLGRIVVVGTLMYITLMVLLRLAGTRTLASMNTFDFIVTVAIGAVFGRAITAKEVALAEPVVAFALLILLQYTVASLQTRWTSFMGIITNPPVLLYFRGQFLRQVMRQQRVSQAELQAAARKKQFGSMDEVEAIVLESSGEFSVIGSLPDGSALGDDLQKQIARETDSGS